MKVYVKVKPKSSEQKVISFGDFRYLVYLKSAPKNNEANIELIKLMSKHLGTPSTRMHISFGKSSDEKIIEVN